MTLSTKRTKHKDDINMNTKEKPYKKRHPKGLQGENLGNKLRLTRVVNITSEQKCRTSIGIRFRLRRCMQARIKNEYVVKIHKDLNIAI